MARKNSAIKPQPPQAAKPQQPQQVSPGGSGQGQSQIVQSQATP